MASLASFSIAWSKPSPRIALSISARASSEWCWDGCGAFFLRCTGRFPWLPGVASLDGVADEALLGACALAAGALAAAADNPSNATLIVAQGGLPLICSGMRSFPFPVRATD